MTASIFARRRWAVPIVLASILTLILAACGSSQVDYVPAGAADGRNTFLFLYTDN